MNLLEVFGLCEMNIYLPTYLGRCCLNICYKNAKENRKAVKAVGPKAQLHMNHVLQLSLVLILWLT